MDFRSKYIRSKDGVFEFVKDLICRLNVYIYMKWKRSTGKTEYVFVCMCGCVYDRICESMFVCVLVRDAFGCGKGGAALGGGEY